MPHIPATYDAILQSLRALRTETEIVDLLRQQLERDLQRGGHPLNLPSEQPDNWVSALAQHLGLLSDERLAALLYLIDMPEALIRQIGNHPEDRQELASAVLYREIVKVYYKLNYSG